MLTRIRILAVLLLATLCCMASQCQWTCTGAATHTGDAGTLVPCWATGGSKATGGTWATTGGSKATGGTSATTGGSKATGGTSAAPLVFPPCSTATRKAGPVLKHKLSPWHPRVHARAVDIFQLSTSIASVWHAANVTKPLNQGNLGSCVGNGAAQCVSAQPWTWALTEPQAVGIYSLATQLDSYAGTYPPTDTGSDGISGCKALVQLGYAHSCIEAADFVAAQSYVQTKPGMFGTPWTSGMFVVDSCGRVQPTGTVDGGHETAFIGLDILNRRAWFRNSWWDTETEPWGVCAPDRSCGYYYLTFADVQTLQASGAEFTFPE
jgi:hypothetical protein